jgi:hypothetical protein
MKPEPYTQLPISREDGLLLIVLPIENKKVLEFNTGMFNRKKGKPCTI